MESRLDAICAVKLLYTSSTHCCDGARVFFFFLSFFSSLISFRPSIHLFGRIKATNTFKRPWDKNSAMESAMAKKKSIPRRLMADSRTTAQRFDSLLNPSTERDGCCIIPSILLQKAPAGTSPAVPYRSPSNKMVK